MDKLTISCLIILIIETNGQVPGLCGEDIISGLLCWQLFPSRVFNVMDAPRLNKVNNSTCSYSLHSSSLIISGANSFSNSPSNNSCDFIPSNTSDYFGEMTNQVTTLSIQNTNITILKNGTFSTWLNTEILEINMNYNLRRIEPGTFQTLFYVWNLSISDNPNLQALEENTFSGMINLQGLRYLRNNLKKISDISIALAPSILPNLTVLYLTGNTINKINKDDFESMEKSKMNTLSITLSKTDWIHEEAFDPLGQLVDLILSRNNLDSSILTPLLDHIINNDSQLENLEIEQNLLTVNIQSLLKTVAQNSSQILYLNLKNNHFGFLRPGFFPKMPKLEKLDLSNVMIDDLPEGVVSEEQMPQLNTLYLGSNLFSGLKPYMVPKTLKILDLSSNENSVPWNTVFEIDPQVLAKLKKLQLLNLSGTRLDIIKKNTFKEAKTLLVLLLRNSFINVIDEGSFSNNNKMFYLDLSNNNFPVINPINKELFRGLDNLLALDLSNCHISYIENDDIFWHLKKLQYLSLRSNAIYKIGENTFESMPYLYTIDLRYNIITEWNKRIFKNNYWLNNTLLDYNHIDTITEAMIEDFLMAKVVQLYGNVISCNCELMNRVNVVMKKRGIVDVKQFSFTDKMNFCFNKQGETLFSYLSMVNSSECINKEWITIVSTTLVTLFLTSIIAYVIYYYYKYDIHFWFLRMKRKLGLLRYIGSKQNKPQEMKYDAFVSYCKEDEKFVEKMVYILEKEKLNLCIFERDFQVGDVLTDKIVECMENSKRTILVLTESFAKSQWCCWEMYMAENRSISLSSSDPNDTLILIKKSIIPESLMTPTLKYLMKTRVFLEWHYNPAKQKVFWEQLKKALSS